MAAPKGNQFWKLAKNIGAPKAFKSPEELWEKATEYFQWCDDNPLYEIKAFNGKDDIKTVSLPKMRAYTLKHLCLFLGVNEVYFNQFNEEKNQEYSKIITRIRDIIYTQKFQGAAADLLNPNIIARELGLAEKNDNKNEHTGEIKIIREVVKNGDD